MSAVRYSRVRIAMVLMLAASAFAIGACRRTKQITKSDNTTLNGAGDSSLVAEDTSKSELSKQYDSLSNKVSGFLKSLLPPGADTTKGRPVLTAPPGTTSPTVNQETPNSGGFLPSPVKPRVEFDSAGYVTQREIFLGGDVRDPNRMTFDEYLHTREENEMGRAFREMLHKQQDTGKSVEPTTGLLGDYGNIQIPIPPSIVPTIFGRPSINLRVSGDVAVHLAYRDNQTYATSGVNFVGSETGLDFKQEINVSTNGTIGDKLKIGADWGSDRMFQFDNLLKLGYTGFPDEILQSFEAGNVNLVTPSQYIGTQQALFGLKAVTRFGPLYVTTLAAQKKGERQTRSFGGGAGGPAVEHVIKPYEYRRNSYFLDTNFRKNYEAFYSTIPALQSNIGRNEYINSSLAADVSVWVSTTNQNDTKKKAAVAWYSLGRLPSGQARYGTSYHINASSDTVYSSFFRKLDTNSYRIDQFTGVLILNQEPSDDQVIAVSYGTTLGRYGENDDAGDELILKLVKPRYLMSRQGIPAWKNLLKNSYYIGGAGFDEKDFSARIVYQQPDGHQVEYVATAGKPLRAISVLGLDRVHNTSPDDKTPDGLVDFGGAIPTSYIVDKRTGTITFPYLEPFGERVLKFLDQQTAIKPTYKRDTRWYLPEIYTLSPDILRQREFKVSINARFSGGISSTLNLNAFNLVEGSVKVTVNGTPLVESQDFRVDYNSGTVSILHPDLINTGNINVEYDVHDIFTNATKNVLGLRGELPMPEHGLLGLSLMNYSMHLPSLKTRQGEEPLSNWILGMDGSYKVDAPAITDFLNYLPIFNLKDKSEFMVRADAALSLPNPNTQKSPMAVDNGASIAYLDDFEGGKNQFPLYMSYGRWVPASQPLDSSYLRRFLVQTFYDSVVNALKGKMYWYENTGVDIHEIKPNQQTVNSTEPAQVLQLIYDPTKAGIYNYKEIPQQNGLGLADTDHWSGMMQYAPGLNVQATNTDAIEVWLNVDFDHGVDPNPVLRFDLGRISEDIIPDTKYETEDSNANGKYDPGEDLGLDHLDDAGERALHPDADDPNDPMHDNYSYTANGTFENINGQQGNETDAKSGYRPDTEDQDGNGSVNLDNNYYEYEIPLNMTNNKYVIGHNNNWYQLRIPLADFRRIIGAQDSSFSNIAYYRLWMKGVHKPVSVQIHELVLVGSQWIRANTGLSSTNPIGDTSLRIGYVDIQDNANAPTNYHEPPGTQREQLPGQTSYILGDEQSLNMILSNVCDTGSVTSLSNRREATRVFPTPNDIFNYRSLAVWVHGDEHDMPKSLASATDTLNKVWVYVRLGTDAFNYYEYRRPLVQDWQNIHIDFATLTALKAARQPNVNFITRPAGDGVPGATLTVVGSPTFTNAPTFVLGVENESHTCLNTNVWWDEMRLLEANDKIDFAYNASTNLKLAEFGNISAAMVNERPDFHRVDERFNIGRALNLQWNVTGEFNMEKILPKWMEDLQTKLHLTVSHSEAISRPKFIANTDIDLDGTINQINADQSLSQQYRQYVTDSLRLNNETLRIRNSIGASQIELRFPGSFFLIPALINRLSFGFGYGEDFLRSPQFEYNRAWSWTASARYSLPPLPNWQLPLLSWVGSSTVLVGNYSGFKFTPFPSLVSFAASVTRGRTHTLDRLSTLSLPPEGSSPEDTLDVLRSRVPLINRVFSATRGMAINWKPFEGGFLSPAFEYTLDVTSNLAPLETRQEFNRQIGLDVNGNPIYNYDSLYAFQRDFGDIMHDIFMKNGALVRPGDDYNASQRVHMATSPRLPTLFGFEKLVRPVFDYRVEYRWQDAQTREQNAKQSAWNNTISTGLEFNVRELGVLLFGKPAADEPSNGVQRGRGDRGRVDPRDVGITPEELPQQGGEERDSPIPGQRNEGRNQVERGEDMRPQVTPNPLGRTTYITDTLPNGRRVTRVDTNVTHLKGVGTAGERDQEYAIDTLLTPIAPGGGQQPVLVENKPEKPPVTLKQILQTVIQKPLFDWNGTKFNFTQTNQSLNGALQGSGSGITNFLARGIFSPEEDANGPSRAYQLGLITDPHGRLLIGFKPQFPFVKFDVRHGDRAPNPRGETVDITDAFTQQNNFELATSRPLWEGANLSLNWKLGFSYDERNTIRILSDGKINPLYTATVGDVSRTFLSIPPLPFINITQSGILRVGEKYSEMVHDEAVREGRAGTVTVANARDSLPPDVHNRIEREAFMQGFETLPFFSGILREYLPRLNYSFSWSGLEKFPLFSFADRASFRNAYNGTYRRQFRQNPGEDINLTALQTIVYGFRPLIALDLSWDKLMNGRLTTSLNYDTQTEWASDYSSNRITKRLSTTIGVTANYQRQGVSIPFLKLNLKNEFGMSFTFSETISGDSYYNFWTIDPNQPDGTANGGLTKTTIEPRISYTVSQQLTLEGFYRYERTTPAASALISPPTRLIMAGVDVRLKIQ